MKKTFLLIDCLYLIQHIDKTKIFSYPPKNMSEVFADKPKGSADVQMCSADVQMCSADVQCRP